MLDPIALSVPVFFVLIGAELIWAKRRGVRAYRLVDTLTNLSCGISSQIVLLVWVTAQLGIYAWVHERFGVVSFEAPERRWIAWAIAFVGVDFLYYWWHRLSHEVNVLWAAHVVHHQSEDYNLGVALRQAVLTSWTAVPFYLPLAVLGIPLPVFALVYALSTLYQFWIHTELVGKIGGPVGFVLNLPSHHRVHHAINPRYLDKNYGATLIVWDRLFGTYVDEDERPVYGITKRLGTFDPLWAQIHYLFDMAKMARSAKTTHERLYVWVASPAWSPKPPAATAATAEEVVGPLAREKYDRPLAPRTATYLTVQYVFVAGATFFLLLFHGAMPRPVLGLSCAAVLASLYAFGAIIEGRSWARHLEIARLVLAIAALGSVIAWKAGA